MNLTVPVAAAFICIASTATYAGDTTFDCLAQPAQRVQIGTPVTGLLASVDVGRGALVMPGDIVARLESTVEQANVALAKAQAEADEAVQAQQTRLTLAEADLGRSQKLVNSGSVATSKVEELQANVEIAKRDLDTEKRKILLAQIELQRQQTLLDRQSIRSPIKGFVAEQTLRAGEFVRQDSPIMTIVQIDPLYIEAYVPVSLWGKIIVGTRGSIILNQPDQQRRSAAVTVVDKVFDAASGTFGVRLELPNPDDQIPAGQRCQVDFNVTSQASVSP
ncbi:efflux RND transporter periplasmic adaptor subunit [Mesorhizobium loti]|uniref:efflux RND transporter periplasmic adaptor subunit n=1 Tax=Rhizobium loti TaxID=381 RepID=UPI0004799DDD|nr:efflux RND transporter periplasmic adaptor subunit [Mesorhizobium loti]